MNETDEKMNEELLFSANQSYNDSNNNLYNPNILQIPTNSMDTLTNSQISLNQHQTQPHDIPQPNVPSPVNLSSSPSNQHHPSILLRTPELLNVVQEGEIMQFSLPSNHQTNYQLNNQQSNQQSFRLSSINTNSSSQPQSSIHHRTSRCINKSLINNQPDYCDCRKNFYRHSMFVGNGLLDYSQNNKQFSNHLHHDEMYEDCSIANTHTIDANNTNMATSTSVDAVNNQWLVNKPHHICPSCNHSTNYKKSCVSLSCDKHLYHVHQPSCQNLNQLSKYDSQEYPDNHQPSNLKNKDLYLDTISQTKFEKEQPRERLTQILGEMIIPFIFAGLGNVATGYMLSSVQHWNVFTNVPQLIILIPALLGLKGKNSKN